MPACSPSLFWVYADASPAFPAFFLVGDVDIWYAGTRCFCSSLADFRGCKGSSSVRALRLFDCALVGGRLCLIGLEQGTDWGFGAGLSCVLIGVVNGV